jgi:hypothetical protein
MTIAPRPAAFATAPPVFSAGALLVDDAAPDMELVAFAVLLALEPPEVMAVGRLEMVMPTEAQSFWTAGMISGGCVSIGFLTLPDVFQQEITGE